MSQELPESSRYGSQREFAQYLERVRTVANAGIITVEAGEVPSAETDRLYELAYEDSDATWGIRPPYDGSYLPDDVLESIDRLEEIGGSSLPETTQKDVLDELEDIERSLESEIEKLGVPRGQLPVLE